MRASAVAAAETVVDVSEVIERSRLGGFQLRAFAVVAACLVMDGFDLTLPPDQAADVARTIPEPPVPGVRAPRPVADALAEGPLSFGGLMAAAGSRDGREVLRALDDLRREGRVERLADGRYALAAAR